MPKVIYRFKKGISDIRSLLFLIEPRNGQVGFMLLGEDSAIEFTPTGIFVPVSTGVL